MKCLIELLVKKEKFILNAIRYRVLLRWFRADLLSGFFIFGTGTDTIPETYHIRYRYRTWIWIRIQNIIFSNSLKATELSLFLSQKVPSTGSTGTGGK